MASTLSAQEKLLSDMEAYYDLLALDGYVKRPYLNYRTLSDSKWDLSDLYHQTENNASNIQAAHIWKEQTDFQLQSKNKAWYFLSPEVYTSYNSTAPYGQNDGLLWQGKGLNAYLSAGVRFEKYGFELTFKPEIAYSMNLPFVFKNDDFKPYYARDWFDDQPDVIALYEGKAREYGYYSIDAPDAPQRFGDKPFVHYGWGDSEIRYTYKALTVGFGSQYAWVGPAHLNPIMHSIHAPSYPKIDIGLRRTQFRIGKVNFGEIEGRLWVGQLRESDYFDNNPDNDKTLFTAITGAYAPSFLKGMTVFVNRSFLCPWETSSLNSVVQALYIPRQMTGARDNWDQRASMGFNYLLPAAGVEMYTELGLNDFSPSAYGYIRYPFHSMTYTSGIRKSIDLHLFSQAMKGEILLEVTNLEISQDFQFQSPATFYSHGQMRKGYTNRGQWLGAGNGTGGNSQYLGFKVYHKKGYLNTFVHRSNPDNDYIYAFSVGTLNPDPADPNFDDIKLNHIKDFKAVVSLGANAVHFIRSNLQLKGGAIFIVEHNPLYNSISWVRTSTRYGVQLQTGLVYYL